MAIYSIQQPQFFCPIEPDSSIRFEYDHRTILGKVRDAVIAIFREIGTKIVFLYKRVFSFSIYDKVDQDISWKNKDGGLFVFIHGLHGQPSDWDKHIKILHSHPETNADVFVPYVPEEGNCSLEEAADPIYRHIKQYAQTHVGKPICLVGTSNGSRIAGLIETRLRQDAPYTPVKVASIAGALFGSSYLKKLNDFGITQWAKWIIKPIVAEELEYGSLKAHQLLGSMLQPLNYRLAERNYEFWASTEDITIGNMGSCLPNLGRSEKRHVVHAQSHTSIVNAVADEVMTSCLNWYYQPKFQVQL